MKHRARSIVTALVTLLATGSLAFAHGLGAHAPTVSFEAHGYEFAGPQTIPTGLVNVAFANHDDEPHHLQLVRLQDGLTVEAFVTALQEQGEAAIALVELVGGPGVLLPGQEASVMVDFEKPGIYFSLCFIANEEGVPHLALGMAQPFEVVASEAPVTEAPEVDLTVSLVDYEFGIPDQVQAGPQTWEIVNEGPEVHEMALMKLLPGKTMADVEAFMATGEGEMPLTFAGGVQALSVGKRNFVTLDLEEGTYVALCFVPSPEMEGAPHMALGMVEAFEVVATIAQN